IFYAFIDIVFFSFFFFFQAEDGIRDFHVTGVQTCALPISSSLGYTNTTMNVGSIQNQGLELGIDAVAINSGDFHWDLNANIAFRSEERRVGKECRSRWPQDH